MKTTWLERMDRIGVQVDRSGVGHCWQRVWADDLPADVAEEIAAEIAGGLETCDNYVATNGMHYRWGEKMNTRDVRYIIEHYSASRQAVALAETMAAGRHHVEQCGTDEETLARASEAMTAEFLAAAGHLSGAESVSFGAEFAD